MLLRDGVVEQVGPPEELYPQPASAYVAGFMGYRNLLEMEAENGAGNGGQVSVGANGLSLRGTDRRDGSGRQRDLRDPPRGPAAGRRAEPGPRRASWWSSTAGRSSRSRR